MKTLSPLTEEQKKRVKHEIKIMQRQLNKQLSICQNLQRKDRIKEIENHIIKLNNMLKNGWTAPKFK